MNCTCSPCSQVSSALINKSSSRSLAEIFFCPARCNPLIEDMSYRTDLGFFSLQNIYMNNGFSSGNSTKGTCGVTWQGSHLLTTISFTSISLLCNNLESMFTGLASQHQAGFTVNQQDQGSDSSHPRNSEQKYCLAFDNVFPLDISESSTFWVWMASRSSHYWKG